MLIDALLNNRYLIACVHTEGNKPLECLEVAYKQSAIGLAIPISIKRATPSERRYGHHQ